MNLWLRGVLNSERVIWGEWIFAGSVQVSCYTLRGCKGVSLLETSGSFPPHTHTLSAFVMILKLWIKLYQFYNKPVFWVILLIQQNVWQWEICKEYILTCHHSGGCKGASTFKMATCGILQWGGYSKRTRRANAAETFFLFYLYLYFFIYVYGYFDCLWFFTMCL